MNKYFDLLMQRLRENAVEGPVNVRRWYDFFTFDLIGMFNVSLYMTHPMRSQGCTLIEDLRLQFPRRTFIWRIIWLP